jgi:hypothetical protein
MGGAPLVLMVVLDVATSVDQKTEKWKAVWVEGK